MNRNFAFVGLYFDVESNTTITMKTSKNFFNVENELMDQIRDEVTNKQEPTTFYVARRFGDTDLIIQKIKYNKHAGVIECTMADEIDEQKSEQPKAEEPKAKSKKGAK